MPSTNTELWANKLREEAGEALGLWAAGFVSKTPDPTLWQQIWWKIWRKWAFMFSDWLHRDC